MKNPLGLKKIHHVRFYVGNAKQAAYYYRRAFGFSEVAYSGLETGERELASYVLAQGRIKFVLSTPLGADHFAAQHIRKHGDGVYDIALEVEDADVAFAEAVRRGAEPALEPVTLSDEHGSVRKAAVHTYGDTVHSFISIIDYKGPFLPGFVETHVPGEEVGLLLIDHMVGNVELGKMEYWANWYRDVMGFERYITFDDKDISTEYSALMSIVMSDGSHNIKFPINEPALGKRKSQIQEYIDFYQGPGVQHIALLCKDIISTVSKLRDNGVEFLYVPQTYYENLVERVGPIEEPMEKLAELGILVDRDDEGYLLQLFTKPVEDRPTLFFEIIQRRGCRGFGKGNFRALFESIEREQARRGNL
ncbi:MAG: 4-hydroxyphenylpyruvate dioxygenase [Acidobacteriota bacterium]|nr:4-hydroxyphenylpyruvate dioxygenase [Blastocatellia bacterium]MDW8413202.1 4-hydroxyphenylpyruvate dioxygenase [Acidobacteriota bacterium]